MIAVTKVLLEALRDLVDSHWLEDSHAVDFDGTVLFSPSYDFSNLRSHRRSELRVDGFECVVWPGGYPDFKWSAYSTYEGSLWFEQFDSEAEARAVCMNLLADVMPDHSVSKAVAAIARTEAALPEPGACHQEPLTVRLDPNAPCRNALARDGKSYPKSNCQRCGTLLRPGWKCAEGVELGRPPMRGCELRDDAVGVFKP